MKKILNALEMKQICGGAVSSGRCYPGEKLFTCTTTYDTGFKSTGAVCSATAFMARKAIDRAITDQVQADPHIRGIECS